MGELFTARKGHSVETRLRRSRSCGGFTLIEVLIATAVIAILMVGLGGVVINTLGVRDDSRERNALAGEARFAMERMVDAVRASRLLLVPRVEDPGTVYSESLRDVLAVTLDPTLDRDRDGFADADNDKDGRVDEDLGDDSTNDGR